MADLTKIKDVSSKYGITARTLRYYEDMGLLSSQRCDEYSYRMYDENAITRLEQILILRKLNIGIRDIQRIFHAPGSEVVLEVLERKSENIDDEIALMHDLKAIVLEFIDQIRQCDFRKDADVKLLYEKARQIEQTLEIDDYKGNPGAVKQLLDVTEKLTKEPDVRITRLPAMQMIISPPGNPEESSGLLQDFHTWAVNELFDGIEGPPYAGKLPMFSWNDEKGFRFIVKKPEPCNPHPWEEFDFAGGLYAVFAAWLPEIYEKYGQVEKWLSQHPMYMPDEKAKEDGRYGMSYIVTPPELMAILQDEQHDIFVPIALR